MVKEYGSGVGVSEVETGGTQSPFAAKTTAGGTVIRPILKHICEIVIVWSVAPSGSPVDSSFDANLSISVGGTGVVLFTGVLDMETPLELTGA